MVSIHTLATAVKADLFWTTLSNQPVTLSGAWAVFRALPNVDVASKSAYARDSWTMNELFDYVQRNILATTVTPPDGAPRLHQLGFGRRAFIALGVLEGTYIPFTW